MTRGGHRPNAGRKAPAGVRITRTIRFAPAEWEQVEQQARDAGVTASEYIRQVLSKKEVKPISIKTRYITPQIWGKVLEGTRETAEKVLGRENCVDRYAANILGDLWDRGEYALAGDVENELADALR